MKEKIRKLLEENHYFLLVTHIHPDADGLSCVLAMTLALENQGKVALPLIEDTPPLYLNFLHGFSKLRSTLPRDFPVEEAVALVFDLAVEDRLGDLAPWVKKTRISIVFDHHDVAGEPLSDLVVLDPQAPATAFLIQDLLETLGWPLDQAIAENLYTGLYSDTGGFRFEKTREEAFLAAARLVKQGARPWVVGEGLLENYPPARFELLKRVLDQRETLFKGKAVVSYLRLKDLKEVRASVTETEDLATFLRSMRGVEVSALVKEIRPEEVGVSLRSRGRVDVARLAEEEGGGGHRRAAGFRKRGWSLEEVLTLVKNKLALALEEMA